MNRRGLLRHFATLAAVTPAVVVLPSAMFGFLKSVQADPAFEGKVIDIDGVVVRRRTFVTQSPVTRRVWSRQFWADASGETFFQSRSGLE
jgi:hypothetical protein